MKKTILAATLMVIAIFAASTLKATSAMAQENNAPQQSGDIKVLMQTTMGDITLLLYGDTPRHQRNFVKLVNEGFYDGLLFHRVIENFMVQTGDPDSRNAAPGQRLGSGSPDYQIDAEILCPKHFHKRGALAAARMPDNVNPEHKSSSSQFYIVVGSTFTPAQLENMEYRLQQGKRQEVFNKLVAENRDSIMTLRRNRDQAALQALNEELAEKARTMVDENPVRFTDEQREAYSTVGGTPHLDGTYTVFGEVLSGMDVVKKIQAVETDSVDRPVNDVKILSMKVLK